VNILFLIREASFSAKGLELVWKKYILFYLNSF